MTKYKRIKDFPSHIGQLVYIHLSHQDLVLEGKVIAIGFTDGDRYVRVKLTAEGHWQITARMHLLGLPMTHEKIIYDNQYREWKLYESDWDGKFAYVMIPEGDFYGVD